MGMFDSPVIRVLTLTTISFLIAVVFLPALNRTLHRFSLGKRMRDEGSAPVYARLHQQKTGTPTMGGVLIWGTVAALAVVFSGVYELFPRSAIGGLNFLSRAQTLLPLGALVASAIVGFVDDYLNARGIGPKGGGLRMRHKMIVYAAIALVGAWWFYAKLEWSIIHVPFIGTFDIDGWFIPFAMLVIVATSFSVNEIDGLDGLAGGTLLAAFAAYAAISFSQGRIDLAALCGVIVGALLAFLWFNIYPAKFFMGDTGAMSLGVTLGIIALLTNTVFLLPIIALPLVIDSGSVILQVASKKFFKRKLFLSTPIHHHFEAKGLPEANITMRFWVIGIVSAVGGLIIALLDKSL